MVDDFVDVRDFAPTFLAAAGLKPPAEMSGSSFLDVLNSEHSGQVEPSRNFVVVGKERHDIGRPHDWGYPVRAIRTPQFLFVHNYEPDRWPAGNPETGFTNVDGSPSKDFLIETGGRFYDLAFGKRPEFELYRVADDPQCLQNLAGDPQYAGNVRELRSRWNQGSWQIRIPASWATGRSSTPTSTWASAATATTNSCDHRKRSPR